MKIKAKVKSKKLNSKLFRDIEKLQTKLKAGYPRENPQTYSIDENGHSVLFKATELNFSDKNYIPYLQIVYEDNKIKYKKKFASIAKQHYKKRDKSLDLLGAEMVNDVRRTLFNIQVFPQDKTGCIYGSVSYLKVK